MAQTIESTNGLAQCGVVLVYCGRMKFPFKIKYISASWGALVAFVFFTALVWLLPSHGEREGVEITLTVSTFLLAILAGFFMSRLNARYDEMRNLISDQDAMWLSMYETSELFGKRFANKMRALIDQYYIVDYDFFLGGYHIGYKESAPVLEEIWHLVDSVKSKEPQIAVDAMITDLTTIEGLRNALSALSTEKMNLGQWLIMILLSFVILLSLYFFGLAGLFFQITSIMLATVLVLILLIMRDLQNFMLGGHPLMVESGQEVLEAIGLPRYYHQRFLDAGMVQVPKNIEYRIGSHEPGADAPDQQIRLVKRSRGKKKVGKKKK